jgi:xanthine dehydrogenase YagS FAD-binding subunit
MATLGGNVLQRTRCPYYRDPSWPACNKRRPGSGCSALSAPNADHAVLGVDDSCIAQYPGDLGVVLAAFEAEIELESPAGRRTIPFSQLHRAADGHPEMETRLRPGEIILGFVVPRRAWARRSLYLKVRNRASYEFALASAAIGLEREGDTVRQARIGLGGLAYRPWRSAEAEAALAGRRLDETAAREAAEAAFAGAKAHQDNGFKIELGRRTLVRALMEANNLQAPEGTG